MPLAVNGRRLVGRLNNSIGNQDSKCLRICLLLWAILFITLAILSMVGIFFFDDIFQSILNKKIALLPGSSTLMAWIKPEVPIYFSVTLFNLTNQHEFVNGARPHFQEVGPYVYKEDRQRYDVEFSNESVPERIYFKHRIGYHFVPEMSVGGEDDALITTYALPNKVASYLYSAIHTKTPRQLLWGYTAMFNTVAYFQDLNLTRVDEFVMDTGASNITNRAVSYKVNGQTELDVWDYPKANEIRGSDGSLAPPGVKLGDKISFIVPRICRSVDMYAVDVVPATNHEHVELLVFSAQSPKAPKSTDPAYFFCKTNDTCPPKGFLPIERCVPTDVGIVLSPPHFYGVDPSHFDNMDGLQPPSAETDTSSVLVEPVTGMILEAYNKIQINIKITQVDQGVGEPNASYYFPLARTEETVVVGHAILDRIYKMIKLRDQVPFICKIVAPITAVIALCMVVMICLSTRSRRQRQSRRVVSAKTDGKTRAMDLLQPPSDVKSLPSEGVPA